MAPVRTKIANAKVVCSTVPEIAGNRDVAGVGAPRDLADVDFAIVRASFAVAETGSVLLSDADLRVNGVAYLAQHLIVLLDPADIVVNPAPRPIAGLSSVIGTMPASTPGHPPRRISRVFLSHGAQGVRSLSVLPVARTARQPRSAEAKAKHRRQFAPGKLTVRFEPNGCAARMSARGAIFLNLPRALRGLIRRPGERALNRVNWGRVRFRGARFADRLRWSPSCQRPGEYHQVPD